MFCRNDLTAKGSTWGQGRTWERGDHDMEQTTSSSSPFLFIDAADDGAGQKSSLVLRLMCLLVHRPSFHPLPDLSLLSAMDTGFPLITRVRGSPDPALQRNEKRERERDDEGEMFTRDFDGAKYYPSYHRHRRGDVEEEEEEMRTGKKEKDV